MCLLRCPHRFADRLRVIRAASSLVDCRDRSPASYAELGRLGRLYARAYGESSGVVSVPAFGFVRATIAISGGER